MVLKKQQQSISQKTTKRTNCKQMCWRVPELQAEGLELPKGQNNLGCKERGGKRDKQASFCYRENKSGQLKNENPLFSPEKHPLNHLLGLWKVVYSVPKLATHHMQVRFELGTIRQQRDLGKNWSKIEMQHANQGHRFANTVFWNGDRNRLQSNCQAWSANWQPCKF